MKLAILGGGGFRTPVVYRAIASGQARTRYDEVVLYDVDAARLARIESVLPQWNSRNEMILALRENAYDVQSTINWKMEDSARSGTVATGAARQSSVPPLMPRERIDAEFIERATAADDQPAPQAPAAQPSGPGWQRAAKGLLRGLGFGT